MKITKYTLLGLVLIICLLYIIFFTIPKLTESENKESKLKENEYLQICDMCGSEWTVILLDAAKQVPKTVEWCANDGKFCWLGLDFITKLIKYKKLDYLKDKKETEYKFISHCFRCNGCRFAAFNPEEWNKLKEEYLNNIKY